MSEVSLSGIHQGVEVAGCPEDCGCIVGCSMYGFGGTGDTFGGNVAKLGRTPSFAVATSVVTAVITLSVADRCCCVVVDGVLPSEGSLVEDNGGGGGGGGGERDGGGGSKKRSNPVAGETT